MLFLLGILVVCVSIGVSYVSEGGNLMLLWQPAEIFIIVGVGIGSVLISTPKHSLKHALGALGNLFKGVPQKADFYFVHSYHVKTVNKTDVIATYEYDAPITAAILNNNIFATQFHPEKSQDYGLKILENFIHWKP